MPVSSGVTTWTVQGHDGGSLVDPTTPPVSLGDLKTWLRYPNPTTASADDGALTQVLLSAWEYAEEIGGPIMPTLYTERFDGWGGTEIVLFHEPVIAVNYVHEYWSTGGLHILAESTPENTIDGYQLDKLTGRLVRVFQGNWPRTWFPGSLNVEVQYIAGQVPVPAKACEAIVELGVHRWQTEFQPRALGFEGAVSMDADDEPANASAGQWIGVPNKVLDKLRMMRTPVLG